MAGFRLSSAGVLRFGLAGALLLSGGAVVAQNSTAAAVNPAPAPGVPDQDKKFVNATAQDTNFEIVTGRLALEKSEATDVRAYAHMVIHDHTALRKMIFTANQATGLKNIGTISMTPDDLATYKKLQGLTGGDFDREYIKELVKGNQKGVDEAKSEAGSAAVPAVKSLAEKRVELDAKHTEKAKQLAQAHHVQS